MRRLECMDGLRGVLAVYVMIGHMAPFAPLPTWLAHPLSHGGATVDMFFILSGLVITGSLEAFRYRARPFLIARAARIFPVFLVVFLAAILVQTVPHGFDLMPWLPPDSPGRLFWSEGLPRHWPVDVAAHVTMTHGLFPAGTLPDVWVSILGASWSLSTEWQFYVLALLLAAWLAARGEVTLRLAWLLIALGTAGVAWDWLAPPSWQFSRAFIGNKAAYFGLGVISTVVVRSGGRAWRGYAVALAATLALIVGHAALGQADLGHGSVGKLLPPVAWTLCLAAQVAPGAVTGLSWLAALLRCRWAQVLGAWSYGIYLVNEPVQELFGVALARFSGGHSGLFTLFWLPGAIVLPIAAAALLHRWIEVPGQQWGRSLIARRRVTTAGAPA